MGLTLTNLERCQQWQHSNSIGLTPEIAQAFLSSVEHSLNQLDTIETKMVQQQHTNDKSLFEFESTLRNSRKSFNAVRKRSPKQYRFRIVDALGEDILDQPSANSADTNQWPTCRPHHSNQTSDFNSDSTHILCGESEPDSYHSENNDRKAQLFTSEVPSSYALTG